MVTTMPNVDPNGLYCVNEVAAALQVDRHTVGRYADQGCIKFRVRKAGRRKVTTGAQIIKCWETMFL